MNLRQEVLHKSSRSKPGSRKSLVTLDPGARRGDEYGLIQRFLTSVIVGLALFSSAAPALAADPFTLFILRMLRDQVISSGIESGFTPSPQASRPASAAAALAAPQPVTESQWLKGLIDDSFIHLGPQQREELHASLQKMLSDPNNAEVRADITAEFTRQAVAMRDAHRHLARLSEADMRLVAAEARAEFEKLPLEQRRQMMLALQHGVPGMPPTLNDLMLAEFNSVPASP